MSIINSDRGHRTHVQRSSDYWGKKWLTAAASKDGDTVRVDASDFDAVFDLTPLEARALAATLLEFAERIEIDPAEGRRSA